MAALQVVVNGGWLSLNCLYGDVEMSTVWPGGSDELSWVLGAQSTCRFTGGEEVECVVGGVPVFAGTLLEPDPSQDSLVAQGLWHQGGKYSAMNAGLTGASGVPNTAIDNAISRGLPWTRPTSIAVAAVALDLSQGPVTIGALLDAHAENNTLRWGVDPLGQVFVKADDTAPTYRIGPIAGGLGYALDDFAAFLICRYLDSATSTFKTVTVTDAVAKSLHGNAEAVVDLTGRGPITSTVATAIGNSVLALGRSTPQWVTSLEVAYGELLNMGGVPVALETVAAGCVVRVYGGFELVQRQNNAMYVDVLIGRTDLAGGILTLQPMQVATRNYQDFVTQALKKTS